MKRLSLLWFTLLIVVWPHVAHAQSEPEEFIKYLTSEDGYAIAAGVAFALAWLAPRVPWTKQVFSSPTNQAYLALGLSILPGIGMALLSHAPIGRIVLIAMTALLAGLAPASTPNIPKDSSPGAAAGVLLLFALGSTGLSACAASPRSIAVDGAAYTQTVLKREAPVIEKLCVRELPTLKEPTWSERTKDCDVAVPVNDLLAKAVKEVKAMLKKPKVETADWLAMAGKLGTATAELVTAMMKLDPKGER